MKIMGFQHLEWARTATTFIVAGAPLFLGDEILEDGRLFLVVKGDDVAVGIEAAEVMSGTPLARYVDSGRLSVRAELEQQAGMDVVVSARLAFSSGSVWVHGRIDDALSTGEKNWRARTALAAVAGDRAPKLPMPNRPVGSGEPVGIDLIGDIGDIGNRAVDLAFVRQNRDASVIVNIDLPGGNLEEANAIYAILTEHPRAVFANIARANSAAALVALGADVRSIAPDGQMLLHPPVFSTLDSVNARDLELHIERLELASRSLSRIVAARTGQPASIVETWLSEETSFGAGEAIDVGLAHHIAWDCAPITPAAIRARFAPIGGPYRPKPAKAAAAPLFAYGARYARGATVRHAGSVFVARRDCFAAPGLEPGRDNAWRRA